MGRGISWLSGGGEGGPEEGIWRAERGSGMGTRMRYLFVASDIRPRVLEAFAEGPRWSLPDVWSCYRG